jgi:glucose dehydrogenase
MTVIVEGGTLPEEEVKAYQEYVKDKYKDEEITLLKIKVDGDSVDLETHKTSQGFQRVRRVTGYLNVVERFNNAKQSEVKDRVPHGYEDYTHTVSGLLDD